MQRGYDPCKLVAAMQRTPFDMRICPPFDMRIWRRARVAWVLAWLALALNALAPVIAYAKTLAWQTGTQSFVVAAADHAHTGRHHHDGGQRHHDGGQQQEIAGHQHHAGHHHFGGGSPAVSDSITPHCQYCLDFAASAPLSLVVAVPAPFVAAAGEPPAGIVASAHSTTHIRIAYPRGPPTFLL